MMMSLKAVFLSYSEFLHSYFGRQLNYISAKSGLGFPRKEDKFKLTRIDYLLLCFMFLSVSGWQANITGRQTLSVLIGTFGALSIAFYGFWSLWENFNPNKVTQPKEKHIPKLQAYLIRKGVLKQK